jgi:hypothetical protein
MPKGPWWLKPVWALSWLDPSNGTEVNSGPTPHMRAKDHSCPQPAQFSLVLLATVRHSFVHRAPSWGPGPARSLKSEAVGTTIIRRVGEDLAWRLIPPVSGQVRGAGAGLGNGHACLYRQAKGGPETGPRPLKNRRQESCSC